MESNGHGNLWVSIGSFIGSVISFVYAQLTAANIAWFIGCAAGVVSIYAGLLTIRERQLRIKQLKSNLLKDTTQDDTTACN